MFQSSHSTYILLSFYGVWFIDPKFEHWQGFKKIFILKVKYYMNKILISENALTKWYLLGSIESLATLKCLIIICCFLPAEFWQKYTEFSELKGHVQTSGYYGGKGRALVRRACPTLSDWLDLIGRKGRAQLCLVDKKGRAKLCLVDRKGRAPVGQGPT
jgi:hypothetical protein